MTVLILEPLEADVVQWLAERHDARFAPELIGDTDGLFDALRDSRALIAPPEVRIDAKLLRSAPTLLAIGRASGGAENIDLDACRKARVEVVRSQASTASAEAEFAIGALLSLLRRVPIEGSDGLKVGRELGCSTVGLLGLTPAAQVLTQLLHAFGSRVVGYDPALHPSDATWARWGIEAVSLSELVAQSDGLVLLLPYFERFRGLIGERHLESARAGQVVVGLSHSGLMDEAALAGALRSGKLRAAWFDSLEPGWLESGRALHGIATLQVTPRLAGTTRESRVRAAWAVARCLDELLRPSPAGNKAPVKAADVY
ncbi:MULTISPECIES: D-isomer specific 2-hydroxyacid dehydrogenase family protein [unclassified Roseateles]|uniref:NAD(P)-dependent oxidoreductase n=1 Tax=unclassified Roseateles TaxID=2626991 RepID=UPI0006FBCC6A|nr:MULTISPECIES: NAD(P)-dependent oxidoreductase [unclassified Roseateles]KQW41183.1 phosphoglycerate dehydrogenase [Pelomonas sp. Root405]KRA67955.1 phosphoglycerate dehydrogenase [Pelomonas sp. Root662]